jgi:hypothetical protein
MYEFKPIENFTPLAQQISDVFYTSFSLSEGGAEGQLIRTLAKNLLETTIAQDILSLPRCIITTSSVVRYFRV